MSLSYTDLIGLDPRIVLSALDIDRVTPILKSQELAQQQRHQQQQLTLQQQQLERQRSDDESQRSLQSLGLMANIRNQELNRQLEQSKFDEANKPYDIRQLQGLYGIISGEQLPSEFASGLSGLSRADIRLIAPTLAQTGANMRAIKAQESFLERQREKSIADTEREKLRIDSREKIANTAQTAAYQRLMANLSSNKDINQMNIQARKDLNDMNNDIRAELQAGRISSNEAIEAQKLAANLYRTNYIGAIAEGRLKYPFGGKEAQVIPPPLPDIKTATPPASPGAQATPPAIPQVDSDYNTNVVVRSTSAIRSISDINILNNMLQVLSQDGKLTPATKQQLGNMIHNRIRDLGGK